MLAGVAPPRPLFLARQALHARFTGASYGHIDARANRRGGLVERIACQAGGPALMPTYTVLLASRS